MSTPRGVINRNLLNVKQSQPPSSPWDGSVGFDDRGHAIFSDPVLSVRAAIKILAKYYIDHNLRTIREIIERWAPMSDGNDPVSYASFIGNALQISIDEPLILFDLRSHEILEPDAMVIILAKMMEMEICTGYKMPDYFWDNALILYSYSLRH